MIVKITDTFNKILSVFSTFGISDALDIILVAVIIYICVRIIRETRAMQLAKGFIFIAIIKINWNEDNPCSSKIHNNI